ncbi:E3 ubiquitin-protein ligase NRDP1-like [Sarcophilus harrisii]
MGYDRARFLGDVDEDLICPICCGVLEEPVQAPNCEHAFCNTCVSQGSSWQQTCPVDGSVVTVPHLRPIPRIMRNMLSKLQITCDNAVAGCNAILRLDNLMAHLLNCEHSPKCPVACKHGCGLEMSNGELPNHNCIEHLHSMVQQQETHITELEKTSAEQKFQLEEQQRDIQLLKAYVHALHNDKPKLRPESSEIIQWVNSLHPEGVPSGEDGSSSPGPTQPPVPKTSAESACSVSSPTS